MKSLTIKKGLVAVAVALMAFAGTTPSYAASQVAIDLPNEQVAGGEVVAVPIIVTGFDVEVLTVSIALNAGTITVNDPDSKLTLGPGYSSLVDQTEIAFRGATADVVSILNTGVTWTAPGDATVLTNLQLRARVGQYTEGSTYDPNTGHTYQFVSEPATWNNARIAAGQMTFEGKTGYLANITSAEENAFISSKTGAADIWFGSTADFNYINEILVAAGKPAVTNDTQSAGEHYWAGGPEAGTLYSTGLGSPSGVNGAYISWAGGEPNNAGSEACAVTNWGGSGGMWNDLPCDWNQPYLVEFDTTGGAASATVSVFDNITGDSLDAFPAKTETETETEVPTDAVEEEVEALADTGYNPAMLLAFALALMAAGITVARRARKN